MHHQTILVSPESEQVVLLSLVNANRPLSYNYFTWKRFTEHIRSKQIKASSTFSTVCDWQSERGERNKSIALLSLNRTLQLRIFA